METIHATRDCTDPFEMIATALHENRPARLIIESKSLIFTPDDYNHYWLGFHLKGCVAVLYADRIGGAAIYIPLDEDWTKLVKSIIAGVNSAYCALNRLPKSYAVKEIPPPDAEGGIRLRLRLDDEDAA